MDSIIKLPLQFDPGQLLSDYQQIRSSDWIPHFNQKDYQGNWAVVALHSIGGFAEQIYAYPPPGVPYAGTEALSRCPYFREVLASLQCELHSVRLMKLAPSATILEHEDDGLRFEEGLARLHIPILTNSSVDFVLGGQKLDMRVGECWYLDFTLPHRISNDGSTDRVHLVIDGVANDWLASLLARGET